MQWKTAVKCLWFWFIRVREAKTMRWLEDIRAQ